MAGACEEYSSIFASCEPLTGKGDVNSKGDV